MFKEYISDENMINMASEVARCMDPELYEKGKDYYRQGLIEWTKLYGSRIYSAVNDDKKYTVVVHIDNFSKSACSCEKKYFCEHIAAVFQRYYEPWLASNKSTPNENFAAGNKAFLKDVAEDTSRASVQHRPRQLMKPQFLDVPVIDGPVERWYEYFEREYERIREIPKSHLQPFIKNFLGDLYCSAFLFSDFMSRVFVHSNNWPLFNRELYRFHSALFFMTRLEKQIKEVNLSEIDRYQIENIEDEFIQALKSIMYGKQQGKYQPFFQKAIEVVRENFLMEKTLLFSWIYVYLLMCGILFDDDDWRKKETACLEESLRGLEENRQGYYYATLGLAGLKMAAHRLDDALVILQKLKEKRVEDMFFFLEHLAGAKEWEKLLVWLRWLAPGVNAADPVLLEDICEYCTLAAKNSQAGEEFIKLVRSWLPSSYDAYAGYLLEADLFREWVELNMSYRIYDWQSTNKSILRHLESREPAALIPLYHQWSARLIEEKNRKSYQEAVKLLKKLRVLYNRQKMGKEWNAFISRLASRYPRMRAFQEELRKGKLIS